MSALDALLEGLFDYAGLYPPASLPLEEALCRSAAFPKSLRRPRLVGADLVLGLERLRDLTPAALETAGFASGRALRLCVLGSPLEGGPEGPGALGTSCANAATEVRAALAFDAARALAANPCRVATFEVKAPPSFFARPSDAGRALAALSSALAAGGCRLFVEPDWPAAEWVARGDAAVAAVEAGACGLKVRGSGPTAVTAEVLARLLPEIVRRRLPFKATAGLHHPFREPKGGGSLGFLSLAAALRLASIEDVSRSEGNILSLLESLDPRDLRSEREGLSWGGRSLSAPALRAAVDAVPFSIGSCSLDEPDEDLARLFPVG